MLLAFSVKVHPIPEINEIQKNYAGLARLTRSRDQQAEACASRDRSLTDVHAGAEDGVGEEKEEEGNVLLPSKISSPVSGAAPQLSSLLAPVHVEIPAEAADADVGGGVARFAAQFAAAERAEEQYIALVYKEYTKRKSLEQKWYKQWVDYYMTLKQHVLPPEVVERLHTVRSLESEEREAIAASYDRFLQWVSDTNPQWIDAAQRQEREREAKETARQTAMAAAKAALAEELAAGRPLPAPAELPSAFNERGEPAYDSVLVDLGVPPTRTELDVSPSELRAKAIHLLEREEQLMKGRKQEQLRALQQEEERLRQQMERHDADRARRQAELDEQQRQRAEDAKVLLEHIAAEEELIRARLAAKEAEKQRAEEAEKQRAAAEKATMYEHVRAEEELLRQRLQAREEAKLAEQRQREAAAKLRQEQEEMLRRAKEQHEREEKEKQLAYLQEQEKMYAERLRARELAEIKAREEQARLRQPSPYSQQPQAYMAPPPPHPQPYHHHQQQPSSLMFAGQPTLYAYGPPPSMHTGIMPYPLQTPPPPPPPHAQYAAQPVMFAGAPTFYTNSPNHQWA